MKINKNSLCYWFPKIKNLDIPQPKTVIYKLPKQIYKRLWFEDFNAFKKINWIEVKKTARKIGYPLFARTDLASGKHYWKNSCFIESEDELERHLWEIVEFNICADVFGGLDFTSFVFREYIEMESGFTAFLGELPINRERRYFIKNGKVLCHHPYWIEDSISRPSIRNWKTVLKKLNEETEDEIELLTSYAEKVAKVLDGYWSVDFCFSKGGVWYLIDCALGKDSWHPECKFKLTKLKRGP